MLKLTFRYFLLMAHKAGRPDRTNYVHILFTSAIRSRLGPKVCCNNIQTYILQVELKLLLIGFKLTGQLVALMVECKQPLQEG